jgi:pyridoxine kinase
MTTATPAGHPTVIVISSLVAQGAVGGRGGLFAFERFGFPVVFVPTTLIAWHPGHGPSTRLDTAPDTFAALLADLGRAAFPFGVAAVVTGYFADPAQVRAAASLIATLRARFPALVQVCDPVLGDAGRLYIRAETAAAVRDDLAAHADIVTPNVFELGFLTGETPPAGLPALAALARALGRPRVVVTSAPSLMRGQIGTLLVTPTEAWLAEHRELPGAPNGTGDLFCALFTAHLLSGLAEKTALNRATAGVFELVAAATRRGRTELPLSEDQDRFMHPMAPVAIRSVAVQVRATSTHD